MDFFRKKKKSVFVRMADMYQGQQVNRLEGAQQAPPPPTASDSIHAEETHAEEAQQPNIPSGMWQKCPYCSRIVYAADLEESSYVCPHCDYNFRLRPGNRIRFTVDEGSFEEINASLQGSNPLDFPGYSEKLAAMRKQTGFSDAVITGFARIHGHPLMLCVMDSNFMMGSMGAAVGEKMVRAFEAAMEKRLPLVVFTCSGGARMQEGMVSLMQMAKVAGAATKFAEAGLLYTVVLTDPTTGGVTASFAMLGDITLAEPGAQIGFAGQRVIKQTTGQNLPDGFQKAEFVQQKGFVDRIVPRHKMRDELGIILSMHEEVAK